MREEAFDGGLINIPQLELSPSGNTELILEPPMHQCLCACEGVVEWFEGSDENNVPFGVHPSNGVFTASRFQIPGYQEMPQQFCSTNRDFLLELWSPGRRRNNQTKTKWDATSAVCKV